MSGTSNQGKTYGSPVQLRDASGNAFGTSANPVYVSGGTGGGGGGSSTVAQGTPGASAWPVSQATQPPPYPVTTTPVSFGTGATANTFTIALAANASRHGGSLFYYGTGTLYVFFGSGTATTALSVRLGPGYGQQLSLTTNAGTVATDAIQVASTAANDTVLTVTQ